MCKKPFRIWIHETDGQRELRCITGGKFDDCQNDTIPIAVCGKRPNMFALASWQISCVPIRKIVKKRESFSYVITGNYCPPGDPNTDDATRDDPSADPFDN